jgi:hypothetical protein
MVATVLRAGIVSANILRQTANQNDHDERKQHLWAGWRDAALTALALVLISGSAWLASLPMRSTVGAVNQLNLHPAVTKVAAEQA